MGAGKLGEEGEGGDGETATSGQNWEDKGGKLTAKKKAKVSMKQFLKLYVLTDLVFLLNGKRTK